MRIIARDQMSTEFIIESDILFVNRTEMLVRHHLIKEEERASRQIKLL